ncbi:MAG TPA: FmdB family zinc ribbon protein [Dermatophilaceae bacterium]|nr:FmdB family zinc ribbon protein [Dermatophilaceae bacterium]
MATYTSQPMRFRGTRRSKTFPRHPPLQDLEEPVPTYAYACTDCDHRFEVFQSFSDDSLTVCPECDGRLRKVFNAVGVVFKGGGFYRTDSRKESASARSGSSDAKSGSSEGSADGSSGSAKDSSGSGSNGSDSKGSDSKGSGSKGSGSANRASSSSSTGSSSAPAKAGASSTAAS